MSLDERLWDGTLFFRFPRQIYTTTQELGIWSKFKLPFRWQPSASSSPLHSPRVTQRVHSSSCSSIFTCHHSLHFTPGHHHNLLFFKRGLINFLYLLLVCLSDEPAASLIFTTRWTQKILFNGSRPTLHPSSRCSIPQRHQSTPILSPSPDTTTRGRLISVS